MRKRADGSGVGEATVLDAAQMRLVDMCAIECELQHCGPLAVPRLLRAWDYAQKRSRAGLPSEQDVFRLGYLIEPEKNGGGYRRVEVSAGGDSKIASRLVPERMGMLLEAVAKMPAAEWFRGFEEVHPFLDGNGRAGLVLYNWLKGTLFDPVWAPDFWGDPRRLPGFGAPESDRASETQTEGP